MHFIMNSFSQRAAQLLTLSQCYVVSEEKCLSSIKIRILVEGWVADVKNCLE